MFDKLTLFLASPLTVAGVGAVFRLHRRGLGCGRLLGFLGCDRLSFVLSLRGRRRGRGGVFDLISRQPARRARPPHSLSWRLRAV